MRPSPALSTGTMPKARTDACAGETANGWYERSAELTSDQIFRTRDGSIVKLDRPVPGDGTKWYVADRFRDVWSYEDSTVEPSDLVELLAAEAV